MIIQETIYTLINDLRHMIALRQLRIERAQVINNALQLIHQRYDTQNSLGFDQKFMRLDAAKLIEPFLYGDAAPAPEAFAMLLAEEFRTNFDVRTNLAEHLYPMMRDFVYLLESGTERVRWPVPLQISYSPVSNPFYNELPCTNQC